MATIRATIHATADERRMNGSFRLSSTRHRHLARILRTIESTGPSQANGADMRVPADMKIRFPKAGDATVVALGVPLARSGRPGD